MTTSQHTYWIYRDGVPAKRVATNQAAKDVAADLQDKYPQSVIEVKFTKLTEHHLFTLKPTKTYQGRETNDA